MEVNLPATTPYSRTALQQAAESGNVDIVNRLLQAGADVNQAPADWAGVTALQAAAIGGFLGIASKLLELGADVNACGAENDGRTALEGAAEHGRIDMVQLLLNAGADVSGTPFGTKQYENAVKFAKEQGYDAVARLLIRHRESLG
ncbi:uncharacterized protein K452DRAFT_239329 [Aplosporella prunicola CBS 121167]|uniref:Uncharacterized protein n=1 Tax=Aplosporella prunicola CBS 121167 TaxID=1176127 RepID=A0A6A6AWA3_9PEZI|nr:uncharacterized protein K452DRAFT_239329 [Aplosporella prunicola CBS 121167]KAF2135463.1 hypothetical protein K452DRAFT_239329 [Aplosporella prunicola CBS 121167]